VVPGHGLTLGSDSLLREGRAADVVAWTCTWCACRPSSALSYASGDRTEDMIVMPLDETERLLSLQVALKCADVGHLAASLEVRPLPYAADSQEVGGTDTCTRYYVALHLLLHPVRSTTHRWFLLVCWQSGSLAVPAPGLLLMASWQ
jgi:hypothetical protein